MKHLKAAIAAVLLIFLISCSKNERQEVKEKMDTASKKLGRELDTLINTSLYSDSLFKKAPVEEPDSSGIAGKNFRESLNDIFDHYTDIKDELADDDTAAVVKHTDEMREALMKAQTESASEKPGGKWKQWVAGTEKIIADLKGAGSLEKQRGFFSELTGAMEEMIKNFGLSNTTVYKVSCKTVKQKNNFWLSDDTSSDNPYYGKNKSNEKSIPCIDVQKAWKFN